CATSCIIRSRTTRTPPSRGSSPRPNSCGNINLSLKFYRSHPKNFLTNEEKRMRMSRRAVALLALLSLFAQGTRASAQQRPAMRGVTPEDYYAFEFLGDPRLSSGGKWVAYVVTTVEQRQNRRLSQIWLAAAD